MRWWVIALVACSKTPEHVSGVSNEKVAATSEKSAPEPEKPAASAEPTPSAEPVASAAPSVSATGTKPKTLSSAEKAALSKELDALDLKAIGSLATASGATATPSSSASTGLAVKQPLGEVSQGAAQGAPPGADAAIARNRWRFKACYNKQLAVDPAASGTIKVSVSLNADGDVAAVAEVSSTAPAMLGSCVKTAFSSIKFDPGPPTKFTVPLVFSPKK